MVSSPVERSDSARRFSERFVFIIARRLVLLLALWWVLTRGDPEAWAIGLPVVLGATALSLILVPRLPGVAFWRLPGFAVFFLRESALGGYDVVKRALNPAMPLQPDFLTVSVAGLGESGRLLFAFLVSLLPGTLSARLDGDILHVHVLDRRMPIEENLQRLRIWIRYMLRQDTGNDRDAL
jgi:multicomponent Na+:H+ antiporter subunit E